MSHIICHINMEYTNNTIPKSLSEISFEPKFNVKTEAQSEKNTGSITEMSFEPKISIYKTEAKKSIRIIRHGKTFIGYVELREYSNSRFFWTCNCIIPIEFIVLFEKACGNMMESDSNGNLDFENYNIAEDKDDINVKNLTTSRAALYTKNHHLIKQILERVRDLDFIGSYNDLFFTEKIHKISWQTSATTSKKDAIQQVIEIWKLVSQFEMV